MPRLKQSKGGISARVKYAKIMKDRNIDLNSVPIFKQTVTMTSLQVRQVHEAFRTQFRLQPAEAMTIHKSQGSTIKTICIDFRNLNKQPDATLKYVALSKTEYDGLYILGNFTAPKPKANKGIVEIERLRKDCQLKLSYYNMTDALGKKVIFHNVRSFAKHQRLLYWK